MLTWLAEYWPTVLGYVGILATTPAAYWLIPDRWLNPPAAWCQGCDELQPSSDMHFTEIGLYRCGACVRDAKQPKDKSWFRRKWEEMADDLAGFGSFTEAIAAQPEVKQLIQAEVDKMVAIWHKEIAELEAREKQLQAWVQAERKHTKELQAKRDRTCPCCNANRPGAYQFAHSEQISGGKHTWTCPTCGCDWKPITGPRTGLWCWRRMSGKYHDTTPRVKDVPIPGKNVVIPLWWPIAESAQRHNGNVYCAICRVTGNHLPYECPQRMHTTVVTGDGTIREHRPMRGAEAVAEGAVKPLTQLETTRSTAGPFSVLQPTGFVAYDPEEAYQHEFEVDGIPGTVRAYRRGEDVRVLFALGDMTPVSIDVPPQEHRGASLAEITDAAVKLCRAGVASHPLQRA